MFPINNVRLPLNLFSTVASRLTPKFINQNSKEWQLFLEMNYSYMQESWPQKFSNMSRSAFIEEYSKKLIKKMDEGNRGLFLYFQSNKPVGLSNAYLLGDKSKVLNIAEFYVVPAMRKQKFGKEMLGHLIGWGKEQGAKEIRIEVDKGLENANRFWSTFKFDLDSSGPRNVYFSRL